MSLNTREQRLGALRLKLDAWGIRILEQWRLGDKDYLMLAGKKRLVLVVVSDDATEHFVQGGAKWADLEFDLKGDGQ